MKQVKASIEIGAPPERVWDVLLDFNSYSEWNPFMADASLRPFLGGSKLSIRFEPPGGTPVRLSPKITEVEEHERLRWIGRLGIPGVLTGDHVHEIEDLGEGRSRYTQTEKFTGLLSGFAGKTIARTQEGFEAMNLALKQRCERL